ncbi:hypothetical protein [Nannocystis pusilla]|uniref:hypothetical protein n=1 Tax=Nannocystis pusilla TaxID=889268 RepID=UPI003B819474
MEAARALEEADQGAIAGEIYERLHMLRRAAVAYERAGAVTQLEYVLGLIDRIEHAEAVLQRASDEIDAALREGRRFFAHDLLQEHLQDARTTRGPLAHSGAPCCAPPSPASRPTSASPSRAASGSTCAGGQVRSRASSCGPTCGSVARPTSSSASAAPASREHAALRLEAIAAAAGTSAHGLDEVELAVALVDLGSRAGTFWRGETLAPASPSPSRVPASSPWACPPPASRSTRSRASAASSAPCCARRARAPPPVDPLPPRRRPLWLAPDRPIPAVLELRPPFIAVRIAAGVRAQLGQEPLGPGASIELLHGDRLHLDLPDGRLTLEISMT